jgi:hypothetical protein
VVNLGAQIEFGSVGQFVVAALDTIVISTYFGSTLVQTYSRTAGASTEAHQYSIKSTFELVNTTPGASEAYALTIFTDSGFTPAPIIEQSFTFVTGINLAASHTFSTTVTLVSSSSLITDYYSSAKAWPI